MFILDGLNVAELGAGQVEQGNNITNSNPTDERTVLAGTRSTTVGELNVYNGLAQQRREIQHVAAMRTTPDAARGQG